MIDTHVHIDFEQFDQDREEIIRRAYEAGIEKIINVGADMGGSQKSIELAGAHENIYASVGLHPHVFNELVASQELSSGQAKTIRELSSEMFNELKNLARNEKVVAIGEIGLDYFSHTDQKITEAQKENQKNGFVAQIKLAKEYGLPVIIHCRDAYKDCYKVLVNFIESLPRDERSEFYAAFHCYGGNLEFTKKLLKLDNIFFSFTGNITYAKAGSEIIEVIKAIPMDKIMLETDCPYLAPVPHRGKRNEPSYVVYVNEKIAEIKQISAKEIDRTTTENAQKFFKLA